MRAETQATIDAIRKSLKLLAQRMDWETAPHRLEELNAMIEAGVLLGLQRDVAHRLAVQTIVGAGTMLAESGESPVQLREKVSSPGGTTITALAELDQRAVRAAMVAAMKACHDKSASMG